MAYEAISVCCQSAEIKRRSERFFVMNVCMRASVFFSLSTAANSLPQQYHLWRVESVLIRFISIPYFPFSVNLDFSPFRAKIGSLNAKYCFIFIPECDAEQHRCTDGSCIAKAKVCDTHSDCPDGDDEVNCCKYTLNAGIAAHAAGIRTTATVYPFHTYRYTYRLLHDQSIQSNYLNI